MINSIELSQKYSRDEVRKLLDFTEAQLAEAEKQELISFAGPGKTIYGLHFFQFLKQHVKKLEAIHGQP